MNLTLLFSRSSRWLNLPGALLLALLQRSPAVQVASTAAEFVTASPVGQVLRAAALAAASLGTIHSMAGATQFVASKNPVTGTVGTPITTATFTVTGAQTPPASFRVMSGSLPPGLTIVGYDTSKNVVNAQIPSITGTPTTAGNYSITLRAYEFQNATGDSWPSTLGSVLSFTISAGVASAPTFTTQPVSQTVNAGATVTFTAAASGSPTPNLQWNFNGTAINGATGATLVLGGVSSANAGNYTVTATNSAGSVTSSAATLTVNVTSGVVPAFTTQPASITLNAGSTAVFRAAATGATSYAWRLNGTTIGNATSASIVITNISNANAGAYTCVATNSAGSATSTAATLTVVSTSTPGRLSNLSILTPLTANETMTLGTVLGGSGTSGTKPLVIRAAGESLQAFNITGYLPNPTLTLTNTSMTPAAMMAKAATWGGTQTLINAMASVGAFSYLSTGSTDAAIYQPALPAGSYTVQVADANNAAGTVIAEIYDGTAPDAFTATTPRLVNVAVLKYIADGTSVTAGFVLAGSTSRTVLIRAIGPRLALAPFGLANTLPAPTITLVSTGTGVTLASNNAWGGDPQLTAVGNAVGAFAVTDAASKDAMVVTTLDPGSYTAQVSPATGTSGGWVIVEVYEVP